MTLSPLIRVLVPPAACVVVALFQQAAAQQRHHLPSRLPIAAGVADASRTSYARDLQPLAAAFTQVAPHVTNIDGSDLWPCFGYPPGPNLDCPTVGNPSVSFPFGGVVLGFPSYVWSLHDKLPGSPGSGYGCDAYLNGTTGPAGSAYKPCGQIATWYEDDTFDSTDDLLQRVVVSQGNKVIYDSGTLDYGPAGPSVNYPVEVILSTDANFGVWQGAGWGRNNGNCSANLHYPLATPNFPGGFYAVASGRTCLPPVSGPALFTTSTVLATPAYTQVTGAACTASGATSPCYTVKWTRTHAIQQDFKIFLD